jgi:hypothetical protein
MALVLFHGTSVDARRGGGQQSTAGRTAPNQRVERTAAERLGFDTIRFMNIIRHGLRARSAAVAHSDRSAKGIMLRILILTFACAFACHAQQGDRPVIPNGVKYRFMDDKQNADVREFLAGQFLRGEVGVSELFIADCTCAPGYWRLVAPSGIESPQVRTFSVPNERTKKTYKLDGAQLKARSDLRAIARHLASEVGSKPIIRRLTTMEIARFWIVIPFDIEEPLFVVESSKRSLVLCLRRAADAQKWHVWWIDALSEYDYGESK